MDWDIASILGDNRNIIPRTALHQSTTPFMSCDLMNENWLDLTVIDTNWSCSFTSYFGPRFIVTWKINCITGPLPTRDGFSQNSHIGQVNICSCINLCSSWMSLKSTKSSHTKQFGLNHSESYLQGISQTTSQQDGEFQNFHPPCSQPPICLFFRELG